MNPIHPRGLLAEVVLRPAGSKGIGAFGALLFAVLQALTPLASEAGGLSRALFPGLNTPERQFDRMMKRWSENARTNMVTETSARFRDETVIPLVRSEMPNPFVAGGPEASRPWAAEAGRVYEKGLAAVCGGYDSIQYLDPRLCARAAKLVEDGCDEPLVLFLSAFDSKLQWHLDAKTSLERISEAERRIADMKGRGYMRLLLKFARWKLGAASYDELKPLFSEWIRERGFTADDEVPLFHLHGAFFGSGKGVLGEETFMAWSGDLVDSWQTLLGAVRVAGQGIPAKINQAGWMSLRDRRRAALDILDEAERIRPGRFETLHYRLVTDGESRYGDWSYRIRLFNEISALRLDDAAALKGFLWFCLYPRWGGDREWRMMRRFADACYDTGRHDTLLPFFYAYAQCCYVRDSATDPAKYFRAHPDVADKCIDVCWQQYTNEFANAFGQVYAPFVGAAVAYYAGRYEDAAKFDDGMFFCPRKLDDLFYDKSEIFHAVSAFAGHHSALCLELQRLYDSGRYRELLEKVGTVDNDVYDNYSAKQYIMTVALYARMKVDFVEGRDVEGNVPSYYPGWWDEGWWRCSDSCWETWKEFKWSDHLTWRAWLPRAHELELTLSPKPHTEGRHVLVVSRSVYEETHHLPINGIPFVTLVWEEDRTGVITGDDYYKMFEIDLDQAQWVAAKGDQRRVGIVCDGAGLEVRIDGVVAISTRQYAPAIRRAPKVGRARFHGENVRISDIVVRKPKGKDGGDPDRHHETTDP